MWVWIKQRIREIRGNALWDLIKATLGVLVALLVLRLIEHYRNTSSDLAVDVSVAIPIGILTGLLIARKKSSVRKSKLFGIAAAGFVLLEACLLIVWWIVRPPSVHRSFASTYELQRNHLGKPQTEAMTDDLLYQASSSTRCSSSFTGVMPGSFYPNRN